MSVAEMGLVARWLADFAWSYVWLGAMFWLFIRQWTPYLWMGMPAAVALSFLAKTWDPGGGSLAIQALRIMGFISLQTISWRYFYFFRDPDRTPAPKAAIVAPADGYVVYLRPVEKGTVPLAIKESRAIALEELLGKTEALESPVLVGIFMTPMSVHVNRAPIAGRVTERHYRPGRHRSMMPMGLRTMLGLRPFERGSDHVLENERETVRLEGEDLFVYITRIADVYVRKIELWKPPGSVVQMGERIGLIKMGSQTDLLFPTVTAQGKRLRVAVREGQYVYAGQTPLAMWESD